MGLRTTDTKNVSLYDSTEGIAFGPVFESDDHAEDFLAWLDRRGESNRVEMLDRSPHHWRYLREVWFAERVDGETGELLSRELGIGSVLAEDCTCERGETIDGTYFPPERHGDCPLHGDRKAVLS